MHLSMEHLNIKRFIIEDNKTRPKQVLVTIRTVQICCSLQKVKLD